MPIPNPPVLKAPQPSRIFFDPFNSSATGHQRAENRLSGSTSWRDSRQYKLAKQFKDSTGGGGKKHLSDLVGAGSENFGKDGRKENGDWEVGAPGLREDGWQDIRSILSGSRKRSSEGLHRETAVKRRRVNSEPLVSKDARLTPVPLGDGTLGNVGDEVPAAYEPQSASDLGVPEEVKPQIFKGLTMYLNGSTMPLVSDHRLRQLWVQHGGNASIALGRRTVTHVILGEQGRGGGLASTKIQKENTTVRGKGIRYVTVKWVLDSIEKGIRQPESRYAQAELKDKLGGSGQRSVATLFRTKSG